MPEPELTLSLGRTDVISGESLALEAVLTNRSREAVQVQSSPYVPITYEFQGEDGRLRYSTSGLAYRRALTSGLRLPPDPEPGFVQVEPNQSREFHQDPALYLLEGLTPGRYLLRAKLPIGERIIESPPVPIRVSPAVIRRLAFSHCARHGSMLTVFDHTDKGGEHWVFLRETAGVQLPAGVAVRLRQSAEGRPIGDLTAGVHVGPGLIRRWTVWLEDGELVFVGPGVGPQPGPLPLPLAEPRLAQPGFHLRDYSGVFAVLGNSKEGAIVQIVRATLDGATASPPAAFFDALPERVLARWEEAGAEPAIQLLWAYVSGPEVRVFARSYNLAGKPLRASPTELYSRPARLLALELDPLAEESGWAHALFESLRRSEGPVYVRIPLSGAPARPQEFRVPAPPKPVNAWAISGLETGGLLVLAHIEDRIWVTSVRRRDWEPLTEPVGAVQHLRLAASTGRYWGALWVDPASGLRWVSDPRFRADA